MASPRLFNRAIKSPATEPSVVPSVPHNVSLGVLGTAMSLSIESTNVSILSLLWTRLTKCRVRPTGVIVPAKNSRLILVSAVLFGARMLGFPILVPMNSRLNTLFPSRRSSVTIVRRLLTLSPLTCIPFSVRSVLVPRGPCMAVAMR